MTKDQIFTEIQNVVSNNPVVVIGSGASVSYGIPGMNQLATELKSFSRSELMSPQNHKGQCRNSLII